MQFTIASIAALAVTGASALPSARQAGAVPVDTPFTVEATHDGVDMQFPFFYGTKGGFYLNALDTGRTCVNAAMNSGGATIKIDVDSSAWLYSTQGAPQQLWVDASGMGQGNIGYTTGDQSAPGARTGFAVDAAGVLTFGGAGFLACPADAGAWRVWVNTGNAQPAGSVGCIPITATAKVATEPADCQYSQ